MNSHTQPSPAARAPYRGKLKAAIFDWAGTTVDHGSLAPVRALQNLFAAKGLQISEEESCRDMGLLKKDHIRKFLAIPRISSIWVERHGSLPSESDVESWFAQFIPMQFDVLEANSAVISGVLEAGRACESETSGLAAPPAARGPCSTCF
jgi:phosphonoacetaldehyde hydrolase